MSSTSWEPRTLSLCSFHLLSLSSLSTPATSRLTTVSRCRQPLSSTSETPQICCLRRLQSGQTHQAHRSVDSRSRTSVDWSPASCPLGPRFCRRHLHQAHLLSASSLDSNSFNGISKCLTPSVIKSRVFDFNLLLPSSLCGQTSPIFQLWKQLQKQLLNLVNYHFLFSKGNPRHERWICGAIDCTMRLRMNPNPIIRNRPAKVSAKKAPRIGVKLVAALQKKMTLALTQNLLLSQTPHLLHWYQARVSDNSLLCYENIAIVCLKQI